VREDVSASDVHLRPATEADVDFVLHVQREAMRPHAERAYGAWDEAARLARFDRATVPAHEIVEIGGEPVGCQWVRRHPDALELVRLYLLPAFQGRGIGTRLVTELGERARRLGLPLRLRVMRVNRAQDLYRRLGFQVVRETDTHLYMERPVPVW